MIEVPKSSSSSDTSQRVPKEKATRPQVTPPTQKEFTQSPARNDDGIKTLDEILPREEPEPPKENLNAVGSEGHTNSWTLPQELVESITKTVWPKGIQFTWDASKYPADFDSTDPNETRSIFKRKFFSRAEIFNPPYDTQIGDKRDRGSKSLNDHVPHLIQCARAGRVPALIVLPNRVKANWYRWAKAQTDIAFITLKRKINYLRGVEKRVAGPAPFSTLLLMRARASDISIDNIEAKIVFPQNWLKSIQWCETGSSIITPRTQYTFAGWSEFVEEAQKRTTKRKDAVPEMKFTVPAVYDDISDLTRPTTQSPLQALLQHITLETDTGAKSVSPKELRAIRAKRMKLEANGRCAHCNLSDHSTPECFSHIPDEFFRLKSAPLQDLVKRITKISHYVMKLPKKRYNVTLGEYLTGPVLQALRQQAESNRTKLHQGHDEEYFDGIFDCQFTRLPNRVHMWLAIGARKAIAIQLVAGFLPRFRGEPQRLIVRESIAPQQRYEVSEQDRIHEEANRIVRIPAEKAKQIVRATCKRFAIHQSQPDGTQKLRVIYDARHLNHWIPHRKFHLPTVRKIEKNGIFKGWWISIDCTKYYFQLPMFWEARKFFAARFPEGEDFFLYNSWPFGVSSAPYVAQTVVNIIAAFLRRVLGMRVFVFLDDFIIQIAEEDDIHPHEAQLRVLFVMTIFVYIGLQTNKKSRLRPAKEILWLGYWVNMIHDRGYGTMNKFQKFKELVLRLAESQEAKIRDIQTALGLFNFLGEENVRLLSRPFDFSLIEAWKDLNVQAADKIDFIRHGNKKIPLPPNAKELFQSWAENLIDAMHFKSDRKVTPTHEIVIVSDASLRIGGYQIFTNERKEINWEKPVTPDAPTDERISIEEFIDLPLITQVQAIYSKKTAPSSYIRELAVLIHAISRAVTENNVDPQIQILVTSFTDNQGLAKKFPRVKWKNPFELALMSSFVASLPKNVQLRTLWHPRTTITAMRADELSKVGDMRLTKAGTKFLQKLNRVVPSIVVSHLTLLLTHDTWCTRFYKEPHLYFIHPLLEPNRARFILTSFKKFETKGWVILSHKVKHCGKILTQFSSKSKFIDVQIRHKEEWLSVIEL